MRVVLAHQSIIRHDAIGADIAAMAAILSTGAEVGLAADFLDLQGPALLDAAALEERLADPDSLLIYHHSLYWERGEQLVRRARCRLLIKDHNITPPRFFRPYSAHYARLCRKGRRQTLTLARLRPDALWVGDSLFNLEEAGMRGNGRSAVLPPFNDAGSWRRVAPREDLLRALITSPELNLLCVGRLAPNKDHAFLLRVLQAFTASYSRPIRLHLIGKRDPELGRYTASLERTAADLGVQERVSWVGEIGADALLAYFLGCDALVSASRHEGFCVPLVEAQALHLPVLARRSSAVPDTLGPGQLLLDDDPLEWAAALHLLGQSAEDQEALRRQGARNYRERFSREALEPRFRSLLQRLGGASA